MNSENNSLQISEDIYRLIRTNRTLAEKKFQQLHHEEQIEIINQSSIKFAREILFLSEDARLILKEINQHKFGELSLQEYLEDSLPILSNCTSEQFSYVLDIDLWRKGKIDQDRFLEWVEIIKEIPGEQFRIITEKLDKNSLATALAPYVEIQLNTEELLLMQHLGQDHMYSMHDLEIKNAEVEAFIRYILVADHDYYNQLIKTMATEDIEEVMNEAKGERDDRVADQKLPGYEEAQILNTYLDHLNLSSLDSLNSTSINIDLTPTNEDIKETTFLEKIRRSQDYKSNHRKQMELKLTKQLAHLTNCVIILDGLSPTDEFQYREGIKKAQSVFNIGLEFISQKSIKIGLEILNEKTAIEIYQTGYTLLRYIQSRASSLLEDEEEIMARFSKKMSTKLRFMDQDYPMTFTEKTKKGQRVTTLSEILTMQQELNSLEEYKDDI